MKVENSSRLEVCRSIYDLDDGRCLDGSCSQDILSMLASSDTSRHVQKRIEQCRHAMTGFQELPKERRKQKRMASLLKFLQEWAIELGAGDMKSIPAG